LVNAVTPNGTPLRLMAVHAHPDDESSKGAATLAKYAAEGAQILVVTMTGGERGDILNPALADNQAVRENLPDVRREEMARAAEALGIDHRWLGFVDSGFPEGDPPEDVPEGSFATLDAAEAAEPLAQLIREFRPHVVTTYDPSGGYPHPDHIHTHTVSVEAVSAAADPDRTPRGQKPWPVPKVYYNRGFSLERSSALHQAMLAEGIDSPFAEWIERASSLPGRVDPVTTRVDASEHFEARDAALRAHASQIDPEGFFFAVPRELERKIWPWEEFELAHATFEVDLPEDDLFAGLR
jgi:mycothiol S-conjugate amidase